MTRLTARQDPRGTEWFFATMRDITPTSCRYVREDDGRIGGPIAYQRLRQSGVTNTTDHTHDRSPTLPADGARCAVLIVGGDMDRGMAFPEILS